MAFNKINLSLMIGKMRNAVSSGSSILENDSGKGKTITKGQFLIFIDALSECLTAFTREIDRLEKEITRLKNI